MIIDAHGHVGGWDQFLVPQPSADWLVATSSRIGIDVTGISHLVAVGYDTRLGNRLALAEAARFPGRLGVWLVADPHDPDGPRVADDLLDTPGVWGFKLHPDTHECPVTDSRYGPYLRRAVERGVPVLSHSQTRSPYSDPADLAEVVDRHPGLTLLAGHAGLWQDGFVRAAELAAAHDGLYLEICGSRLTARWLERLVAIAGAERVLFGTDATFLDPRAGLGKVVNSRLSAHERDLVLGGNAARLLGARLNPER
ncbi:metal-dependent hydrolase [Actinophytocola xinjiangensis]|uniref:Metal-dependent hydrolase n=1 Tax=Actinophytocola xinjiangensis TaxID=485602 RepID=A0A7Z0WMX3_9PSEU|nr:amidohydrolase family protein [Actinophytocola xinjiangensis]OLF11203.1 metal-dependent hydrolase [Actinophytocola xinjiangensis]